MPVLGSKRWAIAEGYIPPDKTDKPHWLISHEAVCLLNASDDAANVELTLYFADREPVGPYRVTLPPRRTQHLRFNDLREPEPIPPGTDFSTVIESDVPIVVQHTRLDSREGRFGLLSTIAYPVT